MLVSGGTESIPGMFKDEALLNIFWNFAFSDAWEQYALNVCFYKDFEGYLNHIKFHHSK